MSAKTQRGEAQRDKILVAAKHLFARQGFGSTGVRQIAEQAGVNPAMINYYFGSKQGLLDAVLGQYFDVILPRALAALGREQSMRETLREIVIAFTEVFRHDLELVRILVSQMPLDRTEHTSFPLPRLVEVIGMVRQSVLPRLEQELGHPLQVQIVMPSLLGVLLGHFLSRPMFENVLGERCDDAFYARFPDIVVGILFDGFRGTEMPGARTPGQAKE